MPVTLIKNKAERIVPRMGVVRLGIKKKSQNDKTYPQNCPYFVLNPDPENRDDPINSLIKHTGKEKPKVITGVVFESDDPEEVYPHYYMMYKSLNPGETNPEKMKNSLVCKGTGLSEDGTPGNAYWYDLNHDPVSGLVPLDEKLKQKLQSEIDELRYRLKNNYENEESPQYLKNEIEAKTGILSKKVKLRKCFGEQCPNFKECGLLMSLNFKVPEASVTGQFVIHTKSKTNIMSVLSELAEIRKYTNRRIRFIPMQIERYTKQIKYIDSKDNTQKFSEQHLFRIKLSSESKERIQLAFKNQTKKLYIDPTNQAEDATILLPGVHHSHQSIPCELVNSEEEIELGNEMKRGTNKNDVIDEKNKWIEDEEVSSLMDSFAKLEGRDFLVGNRKAFAAKFNTKDGLIHKLNEMISRYNINE